MTTTDKNGGGLAAAFVRLIGRGSEGKSNTRLEHCPRCGTTKKFRVAAEIESTGETIHRCEDCNLAMCFD